MSVFRIGQSVKLNGHHTESGLSKGTVLTVSNIFPNGIVSCWWEGKSIIVFSNPMYWISPVVENILLPEEDDCDAGEETPSDEMKEEAMNVIAQSLIDEEEATPCERLRYKIGDAFVVTEDTENLKKGSILYLVEMDAPDVPFFSFSNKLEDSFYVSFDILKKREVKSEAERRGAKFGVNGVVKASGTKVVFQKLFYCAEKKEYWDVFGEESIFRFSPHEIRLDHEPEYKEIPFSEATHEQRMNVENLVNGFGEVTGILQFQSGNYVYQLKGYNYALTRTELIKVRVPA